MYLLQYILVGIIVVVVILFPGGLGGLQSKVHLTQQATGTISYHD